MALMNNINDHRLAFERIVASLELGHSRGPVVSFLELEG